MAAAIAHAVHTPVIPRLVVSSGGVFAHRRSWRRITSSFGRVRCHDSNFDRRIWRKARAKAKLPDLTFHTLRYFVRLDGVRA